MRDGAALLRLLGCHASTPAAKVLHVSLCCGSPLPHVSHCCCPTCRPFLLFPPCGTTCCLADKLLQLYRKAMVLEARFFAAQPHAPPPRECVGALGLVLGW